MADTSSGSTSSGPTPEQVPGLARGGGVEPGDTPPDAGQTSGLSHPQPMPRRVGPIIAIAVIVIFALAMSILLLGRALDLL